MAINVSVQYNGGFLLDTILLTLLCYNPIKCHDADEVLSLQPMIQSKHFDIFSS